MGFGDRLRGVALLGIALVPAQSVAGAMPVPLSCALALAGSEQTWSVALLPDLPLAEVEARDVPAEYGTSHVRIRLSQVGPVLTIGRVSGRVLVQDAAGQVVGRGHCRSIAQAI
jgi:hypothetical protein